jgi:hypothetical protein
MRFFTSNLKTSSLLPLIENDHDFIFLHSNLLSTPTTTEHRAALSTANAIDSDDQNTINDALVQAEQNKKSKWIDNLIIHYTYEARLASYKKDIHQLWHRIFEETPVTNTNLIIGNRNNPNYKRRLVSRRPHQEKYQ